MWARKPWSPSPDPHLTPTLSLTPVDGDHSSLWFPAQILILSSREAPSTLPLSKSTCAIYLQIYFSFPSKAATNDVYVSINDMGWISQACLSVQHQSPLFWKAKRQLCPSVGWLLKADQTSYIEIFSLIALTSKTLQTGAFREENTKYTGQNF